MGHIDRRATALFAAIAQEIREVRALIESIADILVADEALVAQYIEQLQSFDLAIQRSDEAASVLDRIADGMLAVDAVKGVRLTYVQDRLNAALHADRGGYHGAAH